MLRNHILFKMDGRTWIEPDHGGHSLERAIERGWAVRIPADKLRAFLIEEGLL